MVYKVHLLYIFHGCQVHGQGDDQCIAVMAVMPTLIAAPHAHTHTTSPLSHPHLVLIPSPIYHAHMQASFLPPFYTNLFTPYCLKASHTLTHLSCPYSRLLFTPICLIYCLQTSYTLTHLSCLYASLLFTPVCFILFTDYVGSLTCR